MKNILLLLLLPLSMKAQPLHDSLVQKIDNIFRSYTATTPGCAVAVSRGGNVIFQKGYGMANLEYAIPIQPSTIFHIASESKQYVAFCMLLLQKEGKLSIDDDIRKHLDWVPDFGHKITIRHLIHHTSGLRDQWQLLANAGWQLDDVITQDHVIKLVSKQKMLNAVPGEEWNYCNTGYTLMAEIVKKVSGLTLRQFAEKNIFQPLGMTNTHFHDNYQELVPGRAYSYHSGNNKFQHAVLSYSIVGATSLFTTVLDELKWQQNFATGQVGGKDLLEKMQEVSVLNNGRKSNYAFAISSNKLKGWTIVGHGGGDAGFRTFAAHLPEKDLAIVVFSNLGSVNPTALVNQVAEAIIPDTKPEQKTEPVFNPVDSGFYKKLQGSYYSERGDMRTLVWKNGKLMQQHPAASLIEWRLSKGEKNYFHLPGLEASLIIDEKNQKADSVKELKVENSNLTISYKRLPAVAQKVNNSELVGRYYSEETEAFYTITEKNGDLFFEHRKFNTVPLKYFAPDQFNSPYWWMSHIHFLRDKTGKIIAFEVNAGRIQHLRYDKVK